jgi:hypothetical protein
VPLETYFSGKEGAILDSAGVQMSGFVKAKLRLISFDIGAAPQFVFGEYS